MNLSEFLMYFPGYFLASFDDKGENKALITQGNPSKEYFDKLIKLNQLGAGVFFTPNEFTDKRNKESCNGIGAWFFECDHIPKDEQMERIKNSPLKPSIIVETRNSYHVYFLVNKVATVENFTLIQKGLIDFFQSDPAIKDCSRLMRLPGFNHNKEEPYPVKVITTADDVEYYDEGDMLKHFPFIEKEAPRFTAPVKTEDNFWDRAVHLDCKQALTSLSGSSYINNEDVSFRKRQSGGYYVDFNGKPANCWIDNKGLIGGDGAGPTIIQFLEYYGHDKKAIYKILIDRFPELDTRQEKVYYPPVKKVDIMNALDVDDTYKSYTWGSVGLNEKISPIQPHHLIIFAAGSGMGKSTFSFDLCKKNASNGLKTLFISLEMSTDSLKQQFAFKRANLTKSQLGNKRLITDSQKELYKKALIELNNVNNFEIAGLMNPTVGNLQRFILEKSPDLVVVDGLDLLQLDENNGKYEAQEDMIKELMDFTNHNRIPIILLHHLNKSSTSAENQNSVRGSAKIIHGADTVISIKRLDEDKIETPEERVMSIVYELKSRDFGICESAEIYYQNGTFNDTYCQQMTVSEVENALKF